MSLLPERLVIKRQRDEEPVDRLYLQQKRAKSGAVWNRLFSDEQPDESCSPSSEARNGDGRTLRTRASSPKVPTVRATSPSEEYGNKLFGKPRVNWVSQESTPRGSTVAARSDEYGTLQKPMHPNQARQFRLSRNSFLYPSHVEAGHGIQKRKNTRKGQLPMLVEKRASRLAYLAKSGCQEGATHNKSADIPPAGAESQQQQPTSFKRPNATLEELKWRARTWNKQTDKDKLVDQLPSLKDQKEAPTSTSDAESLALADKLHAFSLEMSCGMMEDVPAMENLPAAKDVPAVTPKSTIKFKPKPPPLRAKHLVPQQKPSRDTDMGDGSDLMDDEYVYDTYTRADKPSPDMSMANSRTEGSFQEMRSEKVGVLVIEDEDEPIWQDYCEDIDDNMECDSDDEDSNAEDYYANDYPEEEMDSDDEFGRNPYKYRNNASDDEEWEDEYDEDEVGIADELEDS